MDLRQGAWWTKTTSLSLVTVYELRVHAWVRSKEEISLPLRAVCSRQRRASSASLAVGAGAQLRRGKAPPRHGDYDGGVKVAAKAS